VFLIYGRALGIKKACIHLQAKQEEERNNGHTREFAGSVSNYSWEIKALLADSSTMCQFYFGSYKCVRAANTYVCALWPTCVICL